MSRGYLHEIADGSFKVLRAGDHVTLTYGRSAATRLAIITDPNAGTRDRPRVKVRIYTRYNGRWSKTERRRSPGEILHLGWSGIPLVTPPRQE